jgi:hypothetical protein
LHRARNASITIDQPCAIIWSSNAELTRRAQTLQVSASFAHVFKRM